MEKLIRQIWVLVAIMVALPLWALDGPKFNVAAVKNAEKVIFACDNAAGEKLVLKIKDQAGNVVHQETIVQPTARLYDVSHLGKGVYRFELIGKGGVSAQTVEVRGRESALVMNVTESMQKGIFHLAYFQNFAKEKVYIQIFNEKGEEVYSSHSTEEDFSRLFNLTQQPSGNYTFTITCGEQTLSQTVRVAR
ncbi:MAG: gliding motility-associated C-terminal domain-containing protein [Cytophagales bacterium]|nr:gliding motility-associated C-terminal domain-containing protein [Bernardetiaceae bacterium]MDW8205894.1 gliding motility-associated C-terminal domain-containing protein [Cytophagales bacterium]